jgi:biotin carboxylase
VADDVGPRQEEAVDEELLKALDRIGVADVLVQALATTASIGFRRVSAEARDLAQARLAIESLRALEPVLREGGVEEALVRDLEQARANLQLAYATAVAEPGSAGPEAESQDRGQAEA